MKQRGNYLVISIFLAFAIFVAIIGPYLSLKENEVLVVHDENVTFLKFHPTSSPFTFFNGTPRIFASPINLLDKIVTWLLEEVSLSAQWVQMLRHLISLSVLFISPYFGFRKIAKEMDLPSLSDFDYALVSSTLSLGFYSLISVNSGIATTLDCALAIGLFPYFVGSIWEVAKSRTSIGWISAMKLALLLSIYCYSLIFVFPMLIAVAILTAIALLQQSINKHTFYSLSRIVVLTTPLISYMAVAILVALLFPPDYAINYATSVTETAAGNAIKFGVLGKFLQYHTWTIYNLWLPRAIGGYEAQVTSLFSNFLTLGAIAIGIISFRFIEDWKIRRALIISFLFLIFGVFFGKAYGPPFGGVFNFLLENWPLFFGLIRTPDTKTGLLIALAVSMFLLIFIAALNKTYTRKIYRQIIILGVLCYAGFFGSPFFTGVALMGGGNTYFQDRLPGKLSYIWTITPDQQSVVNYANGIKDPINILTFPPSISVRTRTTGGNYEGQDIFLSQLHHTVFSYPYPSVTEKNVFTRLKALFEENDSTAFEKLNIKLVIVRKYSTEFDAKAFNLFSRRILAGRSTIVFEGPDIAVYKINSNALVDAGTAFNNYKPTLSSYIRIVNTYSQTLVTTFFISIGTFILYFCLMFYMGYTSKTSNK